MNETALLPQRIFLTSLHYTVFSYTSITHKQLRRLTYTIYVAYSSAHTSILEHLKCSSTKAFVVGCLHAVDKNYGTGLTRYGGTVSAQEFHALIPLVYTDHVGYRTSQITKNG